MFLGEYSVKNKKQIPLEGYKCPSKEVDPENFLENRDIINLIETKDSYKFEKDYELKLLDCVHCNECLTSEERCQLNHKFLEDGNKIEGLDEMVESIKTFGTPYGTDQMRIKPPERIPKESKTLYYMGCLSTIRVPKYTEDSLVYLLQKNIDFTILDKEMCCGYPLYVSGAFQEFDECKKYNVEIFQNYDKIICCCPACFFVFKAHYPKEIHEKFEFIVDYLEPTRSKKTGKIGIQHLCQLMNRGYPEVTAFVEDLLESSGYEVEDIPHACCGGGIGYMHRLDVIDNIATNRIQDFLNSNSDYYTTYCVSCWWVLYRFSKMNKVKRKPRSLFNLLM